MLVRGKKGSEYIRIRESVIVILLSAIARTRGKYKRACGNDAQKSQAGIRLNIVHLPGLSSSGCGQDFLNVAATLIFGPWAFVACSRLREGGSAVMISRYVNRLSSLPNIIARMSIRIIYVCIVIVRKRRPEVASGCAVEHCTSSEPELSESGAIFLDRGNDANVRSVGTRNL